MSGKVHPSSPIPSQPASCLQHLQRLPHLRACNTPRPPGLCYRNTTLVGFRTVLGLLHRINSCILGPVGHQIGPRRNPWPSTWWGGHRQAVEGAVAVSSLYVSQAVPLGLAGDRDVPRSLIHWYRHSVSAQWWLSPVILVSHLSSPVWLLSYKMKLSVICCTGKGKPGFVPGIRGLNQEGKD